MQPQMIGRTGAKVQSWDSANPRAVLRRVFDDNPRATREELTDLFIEEVDGRTSIIHTIIRNWVSNNFRSLKSADAGEQARFASTVAKTKAAMKKRAVLMAFSLPDGTVLRDARAAQCRQAGGWLAAVADKIGRKTVGAALTERDLWKLYRSTKS
jgi:hypothetical protein